MMFASLMFIVQKTFWGMFLLGGLIAIVANVVFRYNPPDELVFLPFGISVLFFAAAFSHARRVRSISSVVDASALANRHRHQIDMPLVAEGAFAMVEAALRELPGVEQMESMPDSLQIRAKVRRTESYKNGFFRIFNYSNWLLTLRDKIVATVVPGDDISTVNLLCEPEWAAWRDLFSVDDGVNLENMQSICRAITRRMTEHRRQEQASLKQTVTEKALALAKLRLLQAQVEPHFLYNSLASVQILTRSDPARADQMLGHLITYLRYSLPRTEEALSTLGEELERTRAYLDIMKIRMGARLQFRIDIAEDLRMLSFPTMMLQTLVENAIKHGLEPQSGGGSIWILARDGENSISVTVADDGRGFSMEGGGSGVGLRNLRERLRLAFATDASFIIGPNHPCGVSATIKIPANFLRGARHA